MWPFSKPFSVRIHGTAGMTYQEGEKVLRIDSEMLVGEFDHAIYWSKVTHWNPPFHGEALSEAEKTRIQENIKKELKALRIDWV